jgi:hypothetical protein
LGETLRVFFDVEMVNLVQIEHAELGEFLSSCVPVFSNADLYDGEREGSEAAK